MLGLTNPSPYVALTPGLDQWIEQEVEGGLGGWLAGFEQYDIIFWGPTKGIYAKDVRIWIREHYVAEQIGEWRMYRHR